MTVFTPRAQAISLRAYQRPLSEGAAELETWAQVVERVVGHQQWLWERALGRSLVEKELNELLELKRLILERRVLPAGRTLWLAGTELSQKRESSMFNCAFTHIETVYDLVDVFWLLLQGAGVGFRPITGTLNGFRRPLQDIQLIRSNRTDASGKKHNSESYDAETSTWTIQIGDSAESWAKAVGKLIAGKFPAEKLTLDFSQIRPPGMRLKGYGWASTGDGLLAGAFQKIALILSNRADQLLTRMDIVDIVNHLGTALAARPSGQMALFEYGQPEWEEFSVAKKEWWLRDHAHRQQSNNGLLFTGKPSREELEKLFTLMLESGGSEPAFINACEAERRAPWFKGCHPCGEILLGNKSFCTLVEVNLLAFRGDKVGLERALTLAARMNYRQTMVHLRDEILQEAWQLNNEFLHLCGISLTGIRARRDLTAYDFKRMRNIAVSAAFSMANELNAPLPKNVTCVKPSGTISKIMGRESWGDISEGIHLPLGKYIFHSITFNKEDPLVERFKEAGYTVSEKPYEPHSVLVKFPVRYDHIPFSHQTVTRKNGKIELLEVNNESAIEQLNWYALLQTTWSEQNVSTTISYDPTEVPDIIDWLLENWDAYVGVSFAFRLDPTKNAEELGLPYLTQEVVTQAAYEQYIATLSPINFEGIEASHSIIPNACEGLVCSLSR